MENTTENKARFFALYFNQPVFMKTENSHIWVLDRVRIGTVTKNSILSLRSISSLKDEEYVEVAKRCGFIEQRLTCNYLINAGKGLITLFSEDKHLSVNAIDYLRSIGILIPWMDLSVEDLVSYGWCKTTENGNL